MNTEDVDCESTKECAVISEEFEFFSANLSTDLCGTLWRPEDKGVVRYLVQVLHGLGEHRGRYAEFARCLAQRGIAVYVYDQLGHGESVSSEKLLGYVPPKGGAQILIKDACAIKNLALEEYPDKKFFWYGHGLGSFVVRNALFTDNRGVSGAVLSGSSHYSIPLMRSGYLLSRAIGLFKGKKSYSAFLHNLAEGRYAKSISDARTPYDWISSDPAEVDAYQEDPLCGIPIKAGGYAALFDLMWPMASLMRNYTVPSETALLFIAGEQDPVVKFGEGARKALSVYEVGQVDFADLQMKLYPGRHDILHDTAREQVYRDVLDWFDHYGEKYK